MVWLVSVSFFSSSFHACALEVCTQLHVFCFYSFKINNQLTAILPTDMAHQATVQIDYSKLTVGELMYRPRSLALYYV